LAGVGNTNNATKNMSIKNSFAGAHASTSVYGWSNAYLSVLYAYGGFNQANYVSSRISHRLLAGCNHLRCAGPQWNWPTPTSLSKSRNDGGGSGCCPLHDG
jgi:hypothetical protein